MEEKYKQYIETLGIFIIFVSVIFILYTSWDLYEFLEISSLFKRFEMQLDAIPPQTIFFVIKYLIAVLFIVFSILLIKHKEYGRIGLNITIVSAIFFLLFSPLIFEDRLIGPMSGLDPASAEKFPPPLPFILSAVFSIGLMLVFIFLVKEKTIKIFKSRASGQQE